MAISPELTELFTQTITLSSRTGQDRAGKPTFAVATVHAARVGGQVTLIRSESEGSPGREIVSRQQVWLAGDVVVAVDDRITLPTGIQETVLRFDKPVDEVGDTHHTKLWL